jgi:aspartate aminotransferase
MGPKAPNSCAKLFSYLGRNVYPKMRQLTKFKLEDFFFRYEHREDLINLASSDALPWTERELAQHVPDVLPILESPGFSYPDVEQVAIEPLRAYFRLDQGFDVLPTSGGAEAIFIALNEWALNTGYGNRRLAIPEPAFGAFHGIAAMIGVKPVHYRYLPDKGWSLPWRQLKCSVELNGATVVVNPHNPTGSVLPPERMKRLARLSTGHGNLVIVDEVFRLPHEPSFPLAPNVVVLGSLSKMYGFPGLRFGWIIASEKRIRRMRTIQQYVSLSLSSLATSLGPWIVQHGNDIARTEHLARNRAVLREWAQDNKDKLTISAPEGGTTVVIEFTGKRDARRLFQQFLDHKVLLIPSFKFPGARRGSWFRLGYGGATDSLTEGLEKLIAVLDEERTT